MVTSTFSRWSNLHGNGLEGVVPVPPSVPDYVNIFKSNGTMRCIHAIGVHCVASIVPESTKVMMSAVFIPLVLVFVKGGELHVVMT